MDLVDVVVQEVRYALGDEVADLPHLLDRLAGGIGDVPVIDAGGDVRADVAAAHRHGPVGVQLHLDRQALGLVAGEVDSDLAHHLDHFGPHLARGLGAGGLGAAVGGAVAFEERLGHL